jgi:hypothetical protein
MEGGEKKRPPPLPRTGSRPQHIVYPRVRVPRYVVVAGLTT